MQCELEFADETGDHAVGGVLLTATRIVNAIPAVCDARPGLLSVLDLPLVTGRGLRHPPFLSRPLTARVSSRESKSVLTMCFRATASDQERRARAPANARRRER